MSAKHTPGPWKVCEHSWSDTSILAPGFDHGICRLDINHATEESQSSDEAQMAANAALIAAAPDLLKSLTRAVEYFKDESLSCFSDKDLEDASAAIAKATGATQ